VARTDDLKKLVGDYMSGAYKTSTPRDVPAIQEIQRGKYAATFDATALFLDVRQSSDMTNAFRLQTAAKMLKSYFYGAVKIIHHHGGQVVSFNGDGMLALFTGKTRTGPAVRSAMEIKWFLENILQPKFDAYFNNNARAAGLTFDFGAGIDDSSIFAVKVGIRGTNDITWVGRGANTAAKLANVAASPRRILITEEAYGRLSKYKVSSDGRSMWSDPATQTVGGVTRKVRSSGWGYVIS
jgi:class 3 adenylate cyclase